MWGFLLLLALTVVPTFGIAVEGSGESAATGLEKNRTCDTCMAWMVEIRRAMVQEYCEGMASVWDLVFPPIGSDMRVGEAVYQRERSPVEVMTAWLLSWKIISYPFQFIQFVALSGWKNGLVWWRSLGAVDASGQSWATGSDHQWDSTPLGKAMELNQYAEDSALAFLLFRASDFPHPLSREEKEASAFEDLRVPSATTAAAGMSDMAKPVDRRTLLNFARRGLLRLLQRYRWNEDYPVLIPRPPTSTYVDHAEAAYRKEHPEVQRLEDESIGKILALFAERGLPHLYKPLWEHHHLSKGSLPEWAASAQPSRRGVRTLKKLEAFLATVVASLVTARTSILNAQALRQQGLWSVLRTDIEMCMDTIPPLRLFVEQFCVNTPRQSSNEVESKALQLLLLSDLSFGFCESPLLFKQRHSPDGAQQEKGSSSSQESGIGLQSEAEGERERTADAFLARVERLFHYLMMKATLG